MSRDAFGWAKIKSEQAKRLPGDASSTRSYFRLTRKRGKVILMVFEQDELSGIQASQFGEVHAWFTKLGIPVPRILKVSDNGLFYILEDIGDTTLEIWLSQKPGNDEIEEKYRELSEYLFRIQSFPAPPLLSAFEPLGKTLMQKELLFFHKYFLKVGDSAGLHQFYEKLALSASQKPMKAAHRDYHCRNVVIHKGKLYLVDFQDARLAHPLYDIASLLYDAYYDTGDELRELILADWIDNSDFPAVALQRNLKAIGTFAYQSGVRKKEFYRRFIPRCLSYTRHHLQILGWTKELDLLEGVIPKHGNFSISRGVVVGAVAHL